MSPAHNSEGPTLSYLSYIFSSEKSDGLNRVFPNSCVEVLTTIPQNVTVFTDKVFILPMISMNLPGRLLHDIMGACTSCGVSRLLPMMSPG